MLSPYCCTDWFVSYLVEDCEGTFSHDEAYFCREKSCLDEKEIDEFV